MTVKQARDAAHRWIVEESGAIPGFCAAYAAGSTNWLPDDAELPPASDLDIMVVLAAHAQPGPRRKFLYRGILFEVSYLRQDQFQSPEQVLSDYQLAPSLHTAKIVFDPLGYLGPLLAVVSREYARRPWVRRRCAAAQDKVLASLRSVSADMALHDQVIACLFAAGITTHVLLVAGLRNPTVRTRYVAVRELLAECGHPEFHATLLDLVGSVRLTREQVSRRVTSLAEIFDAASAAISAPFVFASDVSRCARPASIEGSLELIERGYHREAMFWVGVMHCRCRKILSSDAPGFPNENLEEGYLELLADLGLSAYSDIRQRCEDIERTLPRVSSFAEKIVAANGEIKE